MSNIVEQLVSLGVASEHAAVISDGIDEGLTRDELIFKVYNADKPLGVTGATVVVQKALVHLGYERTPKQKRTSWEDAITAQENFDLTDAGFVAEAVAAAEAEGITPATAKRYLKELAEELGVELVDTVRGDTKIASLMSWFENAYRNRAPITAKTIKDQCESIGMTKASSQYYVNMFTKTLTILRNLEAEAPAEAEA
jgi:hypothetical protein